MASIFNALHIGYSGLNAAQVGINTTGHNISNAGTDGYHRQRVVATAATPMRSESGQVGNGVEIQLIKRIFDNFVFDRYTDTYAQKEYTNFEKKTLEQLSTYFPEIDKVGIKADLHKYYNMWQSFSANPDNDSIKIALAKQAEVLSQHVRHTQEQVMTLQSQLNYEVYVNINEVNALAKELTEINKSIDAAEAGILYDANDLRDKRNIIERDLARLIGAVRTSGQIESSMQVANNANMKTGSYTISINGFNLVDGTTFHPLHVSNDNNHNGFYELSFEREDGVLIKMEENINEGKIGSLLNLRGGSIDSTSGVPKNGILQNVIAQLDTFALGLIETTNNLYAQNATDRMDSNPLSIKPASTLLSSGLNIKEGSFNLLVYDIDGKVIAKREIKIDVSTTLTGVAGSNSIQAQMEAQIDDNGDGSAINDIDDYLNFNWAVFAGGDGALEFTLNSIAESRGYKFSLVDNLATKDFSSGTNFAGSFGMHKFYDGNSASNMDLHFKFKGNQTLLSAGYTNVAGDSNLALSMVQHQYEIYNYEVSNKVFKTTSYGMFDIMATAMGTQANSAIIRSETIDTQFNAVQLEYFSTSKASIDEEMANLIKYQTSYGAAAKIITTIDQMMQTLLGIKQ